jgi:hypothetical protein
MVSLTGTCGVVNVEAVSLPPNPTQNITKKKTACFFLSSISTVRMSWRRGTRVYLHFLHKGLCVCIEAKKSLQFSYFLLFSSISIAGKRKVNCVENNNI